MITAWSRKTAALAALLLSIVLSVSFFPATRAFAHEVRPAYLQLTEDTPGVFNVLFKTPMIGDMRLSLNVKLSGNLEPTTPIVSRATGSAMVQTWQILATKPLAGQELRIGGLENTMTDALVRIDYADGSSWTERLTPSSPSATVPAKQGWWGVAQTYLVLGIEHILLGVDHLLFVLALILLVASKRSLIKAITAFTLAHSITLAAATLGFVHVPPKPIEAAIALSIVFVALEVIHARQGKTGLAASAPWLVAFTFGLLHGFGFAGALSEIGMPAGHIPVALLFFNLGVEAGQLMFVAAVLSFAAVVRISQVHLPRWTALVPPYLIGSIAMFWVIQRISVF